MSKQKLTVSRPQLISDGSDKQFRSLIHTLLSLGWQIESIRDGLGRSLGISGVQYTMLTAIAHLEGDTGVTVQDVARHLHMTGSFVTMETGKLAEAGFIQKKQDSSDRRRVRLTLAKRGKGLLDDVTPIQIPVNDMLFDAVSTEDFRALSRIAIKLADNAERAQALLDFLKRKRPVKAAASK